MEWGAQQADALLRVKRWAMQNGGPQVFKLFGYAGTGKTTLAKEIASAFDAGVLFGAYTGKAALCLRKKGCDASTLHSMIYKVMDEEDDGNVEFIWNPDSPASCARLIIVDEVSMVGEELARDLLRFGVKILVLGDPFQLPPVGDGGYFTEGEPDVMLTDIHRQAADNPIIRMSMDLRSGRALEIGKWGDSQVIARRSMERDALAQIVVSSDQVLCGRNQTRHTFNHRIRELKGFVSPWPNTGERLVCLRNNKKKGLLNGGLWTVKGSRNGGSSIRMKLDSLDDELRDIDAVTRREFFTGTEAELEWKDRKGLDEFTYGWVLTCHKAQGSQFDTVTVFDEGSTFREHANRWRYTAITRAAEAVSVVV